MFMDNHYILNVLGFLPGHGTLLQERASLFFPRQSLPPYAGGGLEQARVRSWVPPPQLLVHTLQRCHLAQLPSTK